jgi:predicted RNA-binding Zn-ribbon protein involved in translation (DUF1610 family)
MSNYDHEQDPFYEETAYNEEYYIERERELIRHSNLDLELEELEERHVREMREEDFFRMTQTKAESAGRVFERVDARYTSQICSNCGHRQKMPLAIRVYECEKCGFVRGRDRNSAIIIDRAGQARIHVRGERRRSKKRERGSRPQSEPQRGVD